MTLNQLKQRVIFLGLVIVIVLTPAHAQRKSRKPQPPLSPVQANENAKTQAQQLSDAILKQDYSQAANFALPKLVTVMDGRDAYIAQLKTGIGSLPGSFRLIAVSVGEPHDSITHGNQMVVIVPSSMRFKVPGVFVAEPYYLGVSTDGGRNWKFIGADSSSNKDQLRYLLPGVADKLKLPEEKRPVLYPGLDK